MIMRSETKAGVSLRAVTSADLERIRGWVNDPEIEELLDRVRPVSDLEHEDWFWRMVKDPAVFLFAICERETGKHIGNIWLYNTDFRHRKAELRILIGDKECWGKGYGTEAIGMLVEFGFKKLNLHKIYAYVLSVNPRAKTSFEKNGFSVEGEFQDEYFVNDRYAKGYRLAVLNRT